MSAPETFTLASSLGVVTAAVNQSGADGFSPFRCAIGRIGAGLSSAIDLKSSTFETGQIIAAAHGAEQRRRASSVNDL